MRAISLHGQKPRHWNVLQKVSALDKRGILSLLARGVRGGARRRRPASFFSATFGPPNHGCAPERTAFGVLEPQSSELQEEKTVHALATNLNRMNRRQLGSRQMASGLVGSDAYQAVGAPSPLNLLSSAHRKLHSFLSFELVQPCNQP